MTWQLGARPKLRPRLLSRRAASVSAPLVVLGAGFASCTSSSSSSSSTTTATTTTLPAAEAALLDPKKLTLADFPSGWTVDSSPNAASTQGAPGCLADQVDVKGPTARTSVVFVGPSSAAADVLQTVAVFPPGQAAPSAAQLRSDFESCAHDLTQPSQGRSATVTALGGIPTGDAGVAARMTLSSGGQHGCFDAFYAVRGKVATFISWYSNSTTTSGLEQIAATTLQRL